jgi:oligopeptide/dipeptide ABC transporter ATP-binding protein
MLQIKNLKTHYFTSSGIVQAVDDVSITIESNEIVGLVGESGCGKSTIATSILRLIRPPGKIIDGEIILNDINLVDLSTKSMRDIRGHKIASVFQDPMTYLNPVFKIKMQIAESIITHQNISKREAENRAIELLDLLQIGDPEEVANRYPHQLSGGMLQRALIAIALSCKPLLLIADEPTTALDVTVQAQILEILERLKEEQDMSILLITHNLGIVSEICDRVYLMYAGKIVEYSDVFSLFKTPLHPYTKGLLSSVLSINEFKETLETIEGNVPSLINPPQGCRFYNRCTYKMDICEENEPGVVEPEKNHFVACWLYGKVSK